MKNTTRPQGGVEIFRETRRAYLAGRKNSHLPLSANQSLPRGWRYTGKKLQVAWYELFETSVWQLKARYWQLKAKVLQLSAGIELLKAKVEQLKIWVKHLNT
ncbi:MAG: hypothetical protein LBV74_16520 [Tannerella sp.]|nr:hypothetical protein [Tannerella sp.]